jgi:sugar lactone lactonase YvrE
MIYDNEGRSRELVVRMESVWNALPELTDLQKKNKAEAKKTIQTSREKLQKVALIANPAKFAEVSDPALAYSSMAWFQGKLYVFSSISGRVQIFSSEGAAAADPSIAALPGGIRAAAPARTGFLLQGASGEIVYWNPETSEESSFEDADVADKPILFYQGRLYAASPEGTVTRRSVATKTLGTPSDVLRGAPEAPTSLATDGAVYLLYKDGSTRKYLKGASVQDYAPSVIEPAPAGAADLWASADSDKLVFIDKGGDRALTVDRTTGRLLSQMTAPEFKDLRAGAVDESGRTLYLLTATGSVYRVPLK